jgi:hypothetical protein
VVAAAAQETYPSEQQLLSKDYWQQAYDAGLGYYYYYNEAQQVRRGCCAARTPGSDTSTQPGCARDSQGRRPSSYVFCCFEQHASGPHVLSPSPAPLPA